MLKKKKILVLVLTVAMLVNCITMVGASDYESCYLGETLMVGECGYNSSYASGSTYFYLNDVSVASEVSVSVTACFLTYSNGQPMEMFYNSEEAYGYYDTEVDCYPQIENTDVVGVYASHHGTYGEISDSLHTESGRMDL